MKYSILLFIIIIFILILINIYFLTRSKRNKKGGNIKELLIQSNLETEEIEKNINLLKNKVLLEDESAIFISETDKIKKFINENEVTKFVTKKEKKEYSLLELLKLLKKGNLPQGTIYTTIKNNTYIYL